MIRLKNILLAIVCLLMGVLAFAQAPETISYQAVVRGGNNKLVCHKQISLKASILRGSENGEMVYEEIHTPTTNENGLIYIEIGAGETEQVFTEIDWAQGPYFLKTEIDPNGGVNYSIVAVNEMLSVPYALYAVKAGNAGGSDMTLGNVLANGNDADSQQIKNLAEPSDEQDVATKAYIDEVFTTLNEINDSINRAYLVAIDSLNTMYVGLNNSLSITIDSLNTAYTELNDSLSTEINSLNTAYIELNDSLSTAFDSLNTAYTELNDSLSTAIDSLNTAYTELNDSLSTAIDSLNTAYTELNDSLSTAIDSLNTAFAEMSDSLQDALNQQRQEYEDSQIAAGLGFRDDRDGNFYRKVTIGQQTWMAENLKYLPSVVGPGTDSETEPYYYVYDYEGTDVETAKATENYLTYGVMYNWPAAMNGASSSNANPSGVQGVCPSGWHLPSKAEWQQLSNALPGDNTGSQLAGNTDLWETGELKQDPGFGTSGFGALPGGYYNGIFNSIGYNVNFQCATENCTFEFYYGYTNINLSEGVGDNNSFGFSVRCVCDEIRYSQAEQMNNTLDSLQNAMNEQRQQLEDSQIAAGLGFRDDRDGNFYRMITIGQQTWMGDNLRYLPSDANINWEEVSETDPYYYVCDYQGTDLEAAKATANYSTYGVLYNWPAAMAGASGSDANPSGVQGVCPSGWHMPSSAEWQQLNDALPGDNHGSQIAGSIELWTDNSDINTSDFGTSGFNALPGGQLENSRNFRNVGSTAFFWTTSETGTTSQFIGVGYGNTGIYQGAESVWRGLSVRCVSDEIRYSQAEQMNNTLDSLQNEMNEQRQQLEDMLIDAGIGFRDERDGNFYKMVTIGDQTWMAENLKYLPSVVDHETGSATEAYYYVYGYEGTDVDAAKATGNYKTYGALYNWPAAMAGASSSEANPSGVQGICPSGWHLPSQAEWQQLDNALSGDNHGSQLAGNADLWQSGELVNAAEFGTSGFNVLPGGYRNDGGYFDNLGYYAIFWGATEYNGYTDYASIFYNDTYLNLDYYDKDFGFSVRCVRN